MALPEETWLVSACLLGVACRYDGVSARVETGALAALAGRSVVPICPEAAGGLGIPRPAAHLVGGDGAAVLDGHAQVRTNAEGTDVTAAFLAGAAVARAAALAHRATHACLKARSPSCGCGEVHTDAGLVVGDGVAAAALKRAGLRVITDEDLA